MTLAPAQSDRSALRRGLFTMHPGAFAFVMATGIISTGMLLIGQQAVSDVLLVIAAAGAVALSVAYAWRLGVARAEVRADWHNPERSFGYLTLAAGLNVLAVRLWLASFHSLAIGVGVAGALTWLVLGYAVPVSMLLGPKQHSLVSAINGSWFLWVVATQSVSVTTAVAGANATALGLSDMAGALAAFSVGLWGVGTVLYLMLVGLVTLRLLSSEVTPHALSPSYWIYMGATAITALAGADLLNLPHQIRIVALSVPTVAGLTFMLWSFGSWWVPLLVIFGIWRHLLRREPIAYDATWWSMVFPLGMYAVASMAFAKAERLGFLRSIGQFEIWVAAAVWILVTVIMVGSGLRAVRTG